jgi:hypothetical protein
MAYAEKPDAKKGRPFSSGLIGRQKRFSRACREGKPARKRPDLSTSRGVLANVAACTTYHIALTNVNIASCDTMVETARRPLRTGYITSELCLCASSPVTGELTGYITSELCLCASSPVTGELTGTRHPLLFTSRPHPRSTLGRCATGIRTIEDIAANVGLPFLDVVRVEPCADDSRVDGCSMEKPRTGDEGRGFSGPGWGTTDRRERRHHRLEHPFSAPELRTPTHGNYVGLASDTSIRFPSPKPGSLSFWRLGAVARAPHSCRCSQAWHQYHTAQGFESCPLYPRIASVIRVLP